MTPSVHLINPSNLSFGVAVITPRWLYVLAAATGDRWGEPHIVDETLDPLDFDTIAPGDVVGIGIHTGNALRGYQLGRALRTSPGGSLRVGRLSDDELATMKRLLEKMGAPAAPRTFPPR